MSINPLNDISKVYLEQVSESAVPGKPAERLGAVTAIPKSEQDAARERILAKTKAKRESMKEERNDEPGEGTKQKYGDMRGLDRSGAPTSFGGKWQSKERKAAGAAALAKLNKEEIEIDEAVKGADPEMRKAASAERRAGDKRLSPSTGKGYADQQKQSIAYMDKVTKKNKNVVGLVTKEALDPVGQEDADIDNDGDTDKSDKYLHKRRKAIGKAIAKKKDVKEGFSNWRQELAEVMTDVDTQPIKEKKVENKVKTSAMGGGLKLGEAVEELGGTLLEMVEIDEVDFIVESVYGELLDEGYEEDDIEEAIEYALNEAKVTFGHDTPTGEKKRGNLVKAVGRLARQKLSSKVRGAKTAAKAAVARGARKVAKKALGVARKMEGGKEAPKTAERKPSTYRGAGAGTKEKVSSGSYTPPSKKKAEKPADPWEGSSTTPPKAKAKPKAATKKTAAPKAKAPARKKKASKLDALLSDIRKESVQIDEKTLSKMEMSKREEIVKSMKDKASDFEKRYPGRGKEVMYATATKMAKKIAESATEIPMTKQELALQQRKTSLEVQIAKKRQQEMAKTGKKGPQV